MLHTCDQVHGEAVQSMLRTALNGWTTSHRLHTGTDPGCNFLCGSRERDTFSHYLRCGRLRQAVEGVHSVPSRDLEIRAWMGVGPAASPVASVRGAQRVVMATLSYHWARAECRGSRELRFVPLDAPWVAGLARIVREVAAMVPLSRPRARRSQRVTAGPPQAFVNTCVL